MYRVIFLAAAVALIFPAVAAAETSTGLYFSVQTGLNLPFDEEWDFGGGNEVEPDWESAAFGTASLGYQWDNIRTELEIGHRNNSLDTAVFSLAGGGGVPAANRLISAAGNGEFAGDGDATVWSAMANFIYDFDSEARFRPYAGFGLGAANVDYSGINSASSIIVNDDDTAFAYQLLLGLSWQFTVRGAIELRYTLLGVSGVELTSTEGEMLDTDPLQNSLGLVLRWYFSGEEKS